MFAQHHVDHLKLHLCPLDLFRELFPDKDSPLIRGVLGRFGITEQLALQRIENLSGGQKSRVAFALVTMNNPHFLIMESVRVRMTVCV